MRKIFFVITILLFIPTIAICYFGIANIFFMLMGVGFIEPLTTCNEYVGKEEFLRRYYQQGSELREFIVEIKDSKAFVALRSGYLTECADRSKGALFVHVDGFYGYVYFLYKYGKDIDGIPYAFYAFKDSTRESTEDLDLIDIDSLK